MLPPLLEGFRSYKDTRMFSLRSLATLRNTWYVTHLYRFIEKEKLSSLNESASRVAESRRSCSCFPFFSSASLTRTFLPQPVPHSAAASLLTFKTLKMVSLFHHAWGRINHRNYSSRSWSLQFFNLVSLWRVWDIGNRKKSAGTEPSVRWFRRNRVSSAMLDIQVNVNFLVLQERSPFARYWNMWFIRRSNRTLWARKGG